MKYKTMKDCKKLFRYILKGWKIRYSKKPSNPPWPHVEIDHKNKKAVIFPFDHRTGKDKIRVPRDYFLHEILHVCIRAIELSTDMKRKYNREERLVCILCELIERNP